MAPLPDRLDFASADSVLCIDHDAVVANWRWLDSKTAPTTETAAMVKADGYGLGAAELVPDLAAAGCRTFFVMSLAEAVTVRAALADAGSEEADIFALGGCHRGQEADFIAHGIKPVINTLEQFGRLKMAAGKAGDSFPAALHIDTGMTRLGLDGDEAGWLFDRMSDDTSTFDGLDIRYVMSHLSAGEDLADPASATQLGRFAEIRQHFPHTACSFANSAGILLDGAYHFQLTRPGISLYGVHPAGKALVPEQKPDADALRPVVSWHARILQIRNAAAGDAVGYNGTHVLSRDSRVATLGVGYADGYRRSLGDVARVHIGEMAAPVIGRVSMDSITVDVTDIPAALLDHANTATILGPDYPLAEIAADAGTMGYEFLTRLGTRPRRLRLTA